MRGSTPVNCPPTSTCHQCCVPVPGAVTHAIVCASALMAGSTRQLTAWYRHAPSGPYRTMLMLGGSGCAASVGGPKFLPMTRISTPPSVVDRVVPAPWMSTSTGGLYDRRSVETVAVDREQADSVNDMLVPTPAAVAHSSVVCGDAGSCRQSTP